MSIFQHFLNCPKYMLPVLFTMVILSRVVVNHATTTAVHAAEASAEVRAFENLYFLPFVHSKAPLRPMTSQCERRGGGSWSDSVYARGERCLEKNKSFHYYILLSSARTHSQGPTCVSRIFCSIIFFNVICCCCFKGHYWLYVFFCL